MKLHRKAKVIDTNVSSYSNGTVIKVAPKAEYTDNYLEEEFIVMVISDVTGKIAILDITDGIYYTDIEKYNVKEIIPCELYEC